MCFRVHVLGVGWEALSGGVLNGFRDFQVGFGVRHLESGVWRLCVYVRYIRIRIILLVSL